MKRFAVAASMTVFALVIGAMTSLVAVAHTPEGGGQHCHNTYGGEPGQHAFSLANGGFCASYPAYRAADPDPYTVARKGNPSAPTAPDGTTQRSGDLLFVQDHGHSYTIGQRYTWDGNDYAVQRISWQGVTIDTTDPLPAVTPTPEETATPVMS